MQATGECLSWNMTSTEAAHPTAEAKTRAYILLNLALKDVIERARSFTYAQGEPKEDPAAKVQGAV